MTTRKQEMVHALKTYPKNINDYPEGPVVTADDLERSKSGTEKIKRFHRKRLE